MIITLAASPTISNSVLWKLYTGIGASSSTAADSGITTGKTADWSTESVFRKFYYRSSRDPSYGHAVLSSISMVPPSHALYHTLGLLSKGQRCEIMEDFIRMSADAQ